MRRRNSLLNIVLQHTLRATWRFVQISSPLSTQPGQYKYTLEHLLQFIRLKSSSRPDHKLRFNAHLTMPTPADVGQRHIKLEDQGDTLSLHNNIPMIQDQSPDLPLRCWQPQQSPEQHRPTKPQNSKSRKISSTVISSLLFCTQNTEVNIKTYWVIYSF